MRLMAMTREIYAAVIVLFVLLAIVVLRTITGDKVHISYEDITITMAGVVLVLLLAGRISKLAFTGKGIDIEVAVRAIQSASSKDAKKASLPLETLEISEKGDIEQIPSLIRNRVPAISVRLSSGSYTEDAVQKHLECLTPHEFFRFVVLLQPSGEFFGIISARILLGILIADPSSASGWSFAKFVKLVNRGGIEDQARLSTLPGFVSNKQAIDVDSDKLQALEKMEAPHVSWLPVIENGILRGIIERPALSASMVVDVARQIRNNSAEAI